MGVCAMLRPRSCRPTPALGCAPTTPRLLNALDSYNWHPRTNSRRSSNCSPLADTPSPVKRHAARWSGRPSREKSPASWPNRPGSMIE
jgi:hypothetical protein